MSDRACWYELSSFAGFKTLDIFNSKDDNIGTVRCHAAFNSTD